MSTSSDLDPPYTFGRLPSALAPFPFTPRQYARLLILRGRVRDAVFGSEIAKSAGLPLRRAPTLIRREGLLWQCARCGIATGGRCLDQPPLCISCRPHAAGIQIARAILATAGVLDTA